MKPSIRPINLVTVLRNAALVSTVVSVLCTSVITACVHQRASHSNINAACRWCGPSLTDKPNGIQCQYQTHDIDVAVDCYPRMEIQFPYFGGGTINALTVDHTGGTCSSGVCTGTTASQPYTTDGHMIMQNQECPYWG